MIHVHDNQWEMTEPAYNHQPQTVDSDLFCSCCLFQTLTSDRYTGSDDYDAFEGVCKTSKTNSAELEANHRSTWAEDSCSRPSFSGTHRTPAARKG